MLIERMRERLAADSKSIKSPADKPPSGSTWIHEINWKAWAKLEEVP